jgi:hypothetical protein
MTKAATLLAIAFAIVATLAVVPGRAQQTWTGVVSDTICGASHRAMASQAGVDDKECTIQCVKSNAKYVLATTVDGKNRNLIIANPDFPKLEAYAGDKVTITGELKNSALVISKIDRVPDQK